MKLIISKYTIIILCKYTIIIIYKYTIIILSHNVEHTSQTHICDHRERTARTFLYDKNTSCNILPTTLPKAVRSSVYWGTTIAIHPMPHGHFCVSHINTTGFVLRDQFQVKSVHQCLDAWIPGNHHPEDGCL